MGQTTQKRHMELKPGFEEFFYSVEEVMNAIKVLEKHYEACISEAKK